MFVLEEGKYTEQKQYFGANWTLSLFVLNNVWCNLDIRFDCAKQCFGANWTMTSLNNVLVRTGQ